MALQQPFGDVGIPDRHGRGHYWPGRPPSGSTTRGQAGCAPAGQEQSRHHQALDQETAVDNGGADGNREVLGAVRGAASLSPSAASDKYDRGVETASRSRR